MSGIEVKGLNETLAELKTAGELKGADAAMRTWAYRLMGELATYPAPPPTSTYVRTGTLGREWTVEESFLHYVVGNNVQYGPYVQSYEMQAWMHVGRWQTDKGVLDNHAAEIIADVGEGAVNGQ